MIPLLYNLRKGVRVEKREGSCLVISEAPLTVLRVAERAAGILQLCDGSTYLTEIAEKSGFLGEEQVFKICEYFSKKGLLEIGPAGESQALPSVTIIIPTKDRKTELTECLQSVLSQNYPVDSVEIIVVDDGSEDGTADLVRQFPVKLLSHKDTRGQSYCRNLAAKVARGEVLAFIDSDCIASKAWLRELVTYFQWDQVGAVGGYVDGCFDKSGLDRYEKAFSPLNMGGRVLYDGDNSSTFYVPTCNLLVRRDVYAKTGGITESMHVGEDVDFCWRMRRSGYALLYIPVGVVQHEHRNNLIGMMKRRADYGTSEALLYSLHKEKRKTFQLQPFAAMAFLALCLTVLFSLPSLLLSAGVCLILDVAIKAARIFRKHVSISLWKICFSVIRSHIAFFYFVSFHLIRYYTVFLLALGILFPPLWILCLSFFILSASVGYRIRRPHLFFPVFLIYYAIDHIAYQLGVLAGCIRQRTFGSYAPRFVRRMAGFP